MLTLGVSLSPGLSLAQPTANLHGTGYDQKPIHLVTLKLTGPSSNHARKSPAALSEQRFPAKGSKSYVRYAKSGGGISCVPFARQASGIELKGNAANWWDEADGLYARGSQPEPGSVLNFRANAAMRLGHVAVVSAVVSSREIEINHANWSGPGAGAGGVSRNISVIDVSPDNDWTAVRVGLGHTGQYGSIYPTYGFIYDHQGPDVTAPTFTASVIPAPEVNTPPRDLRARTQRTMTASAHITPRFYDEVAEAPAGRGLDLNISDQMDAPDRSFR
jgi:surface antigen